MRERLSLGSHEDNRVCKMTTVGGMGNEGGEGGMVPGRKVGKLAEVEGGGGPWTLRVCKTGSRRNGGAKPFEEEGCSNGRWRRVE